MECTRAGVQEGQREARARHSGMSVVLPWWRAVGAGNVQRICRRDIMSGGVHAGKCFPPCGHLPGFGMASRIWC